LPSNWKTRWKIYGGERRFIADGSLIHESVIERQKAGGYNPPNLPAGFQIEPF
jgi:hypothetical protein